MSLTYPTVYHPSVAAAMEASVPTSPAVAEPVVEQLGAEPATETAVTAARGQRRRRVRPGQVGAVLGWLVVVAGAALMIVPSLLGYDRYVIVSGSMHPLVDRGSIVFSKDVPVEELAVGDIITYLPPAESGVDHLVTHRISSITFDDAGQRVLKTKGDANPGDDPWTFQLVGGRQNVYAFSVPYVGQALLALANPHTRMLVVGIPAGLVALSALFELLGITLRRPGWAQA